MARFDKQEELRAWLSGWERAIARPNSIDWLRTRAAGQLELDLAA